MHHVPTIRGAGYKTENGWSGMMMTRPSLSKARYQGEWVCHRVRSRRDLNPAFNTTRSLRDRTPKCLRHIGVHRLIAEGVGRE